MFISQEIESYYDQEFDKLGNLLNDSTFLITGATGVVGLHILYVISALITRGVRIGGDLVSFSERVPQVKNLKKFSSVALDCGDERSLAELKRSSAEYTHVIHAAGYGQPNRFMGDPLGVIALNTKGTTALAEIAMESSARFLFLSSSEIYSGSHSKPDESAIGVTTPQHPRAAYIEAKRIGETICETYRKEGLSATSARLALAYGPGARVDDGRVLNQFIMRALQNKQLQLMDAGSARRSYLFGVDAAVGLLKVLTCGTQSVYNVGGSSSISILGLAKEVGKLAAVKVVAPKQDEASIYDSSAPRDVSLNTDRYLSEFGQLEFVTLEEGLQETINWYRALLTK